MNLPELRIRPFAPSDQAAVRALVNAGLGEHFGFVDERYNPDLDNIAASYLDRGHVFIVADMAGVLIGTGALVVEDARTGRIARVSVAPGQRGRGVGRRLVQHLLDAARQRGLDRIVVETNRDWEDAKALYGACGFRQTAEDDVSSYFELALAGETDT